MQLVPLREDGAPDIDKLNSECAADYLTDLRNPRWVAKPTVAYLWARTVKCKNCRAVVPLLKTRWLCKKDRKRVLLRMEPNDERTGVAFGVQKDVPVQGGNAAQRREHDKRIGQGTMSRAGARCPCCPTIVTTEDIRLEGQAGKVSVIPMAVVVDGLSGQEYRLPTELEANLADQEDGNLHAVYDQIPLGLPGKTIPEGASRVGGGSLFTVYTYGFTAWGQLFRPRQLLSLGTIVHHSRDARDAMNVEDYPDSWTEAVCAALSVGLDKLADRSSAFCRWDAGYTKVSSTFARFALPIRWDFCEANPLSDTTENYGSCVSWVVEVIQHAMRASCQPADARAICTSAIKGPCDGDFDLCITDPPYYDAIPYSDLMDFLYVWLRRSLHGLTPEIDRVFCGELSPKWDHEHNDGKLIDDASRYDGDNRKSKAAYEEGMARAFFQCHHVLRQSGRLVVVFAHKNPEAWESLVSAIIRAGFVVDGSWPIQTEMSNRSRAHSSAALASSVWLVCKKRPETARPGWDNRMARSRRERATMADRLDDVTAYYLLHRHDFGLAHVPAGGCILYAVSCGLSDSELADAWDILSRTGGREEDDAETGGRGDAEIADEGEDTEEEEGSGSKVKLKTWAQRNRKSMGYEAPGGRPVPLIDRLHRLMHLWRVGDAAKVDEYLDNYGLRRHELFRRLLQSLIELSPAGSDERATLESISNHIGAKGAKPRETRRLPGIATDAESEDQ